MNFVVLSFLISSFKKPVIGPLWNGGFIQKITNNDFNQSQRANLRAKFKRCLKDFPSRYIVLTGLISETQQIWVMDNKKQNHKNEHYNVH